jgi:hypothetical protein
MNGADLAGLSRETDCSEPGGAGAHINEIDLLRQDIERLRMALPAPPFVELPAITDWTGRLPTHPSDQYDTRSPADIQRLVIHHSAVPAGIGPEPIARYQVERRGWPGIGYHFFISAAGEICKTNDLSTVCYHAREYSGIGVGICLAGQFDDALPTEEQLTASAGLCAHLCGRLGLHAALGAVIGHGELMDTTCPGKHWLAGVNWRAQLLARIADMQDAEMHRRNRAIGHYLLFWHDADTWDTEAWVAAAPYVGWFRPVCGFSLEAARYADYVTIVGDESRFPLEIEAQLRAAGCVVERIAGDGNATLSSIFAGMVRRNQRFLTVGL